MLILYAMVYVVLLTLVARELSAASSRAPVTMMRSLCRGRAGSSVDFASPIRFLTKRVISGLPAPIYASVLLALIAVVCLVAQLFLMYACMYCVRWTLMAVATCGMFVSRKFATERVGIQGSFVGWVRELYDISYAGTERGTLLDIMRDVRPDNPVTAFSWVRIVKFNALNLAFALFVLFWTWLIWAGSSRKPTNLPTYSSAPVFGVNLAFVAVNFVGSFM